MTDAEEHEAVKTLGMAIGFGNVMSLASRIWAEQLKERGHPKGGNFIVGPCSAFVVPCGCNRPSKCEWCCGTEWLTVRSAEAKAAEGDTP